MSFQSLTAHRVIRIAACCLLLGCNRPESTFSCGRGCVASLAYSPDGKLLASGGATGVKIWELATGTIVAAPPQAGMFPNVAFGAGGKDLITQGEHSITVWDIGFIRANYEHVVVKKNIQDLHRLGWGEHKINVNSSIHRLRSGCGGTDALGIGDKFVVLAELAKLRLTGGYMSAGDDLTVAAIHPTEDLVYLGHKGGKVSMSNFNGLAQPPYMMLGTGLKLESSVRQLAVSPDGKLLAIATADNKVHVWRANLFTESNQRVGGPWEHPQPIGALAFDPTGAILGTTCSPFASNAASETRIWEVRTGKLRGRILAHTGETSLAFAPNGETFATGDMTGDIRIWKTPMP